MHGQFIWYELTTPDVDAARKFYPRFTGWGTQPFDKDYTMWTTGGVPLAGLFRLSDEMRQRGVPPNWLPYVESSDVDETARKATSLGGKVMNGPSDVPGVGRYAVLLDPQGAAFGVYKSNDPTLGAWDGKAVVGRFSWHELMTTDYLAAFAFYQALFGWEKTGEMDMGGGNMYFMYGKGGMAYGGLFNRTPDMAGMHPFWLVYILVPDVAKAVATATKAGATVHRPQMDIPGGSIAILGDPQGAGFALHHVNAQPAAAAAPPKKKAAVKKAAVKKAAVKKAAVKKAKPAARPAARKAATNKKAAAKKAPARKKSAARKAPKKKAVARATRAKAKPRAKARTRAKATTRRTARARKR